MIALLDVVRDALKAELAIQVVSLPPPLCRPHCLHRPQDPCKPLVEPEPTTSARNTSSALRRAAPTNTSDRNATAAREVAAEHRKPKT